MNLLQPSNINPNLSAHTYLFGNFDFNKTPLAPPGSKVVIHTKPSNRASWDLNGKVGFYTGPAKNHYRCMTCFIPSTKAEIITDTLVFIPHTIPIPNITTNNFLTQAASDIITLHTCLPSHIPSTLQLGNSTRNGLLHLATLLNTNDITNSVVNKQENQRNIIAATINKKQQESPTNISFEHDIKLLKSAFLKLTKALIYIKQKRSL